MNQTPTELLFLAAIVQPVQQAQIIYLLKNKMRITVVSFEPTDLPAHEQLTVKLLSDADTAIFISKLHPKIVLCAGWMSTTYLRWSRHFKKKGAQTVCMMDNQWKGTLKQRILALFSSITVQSCFTHAWVPGKSQEKYARKLGFNKANTLQYLYAIDTQRYADLRIDVSRKRFLFYGRLIARKLEIFLQVYNTLTAEEKNGWELLVIGDGPMQENELLKENALTLVKHKSPAELLPIIREGGVFVLVAENEPWAVSIQEAAAAGMPLLISKQCGASTDFIRHMWNGMLVDVQNEDEIRRALIFYMHAPLPLLENWSARSKQLGLKYGLADWWAQWQRLLSLQQ